MERRVMLACLMAPDQRALRRRQGCARRGDVAVPFAGHEAGDNLAGASARERARTMNAVKAAHSSDFICLTCITACRVWCRR
jgi:hypothetical protein